MNVAKVDNQTAGCRALCHQNDYEVVAAFTDDGLSAYKVDVERPDFEKLWTFIESGGCDVVVAMADDRLTRGGGLEALKFGAHCAEYRVVTHTALESRRDPSDNMGELMNFLSGWKSNQGVKSNIKRQRDANAHRRAPGHPSKAGIRPFGYKPDKMKLEQREVALRKATEMLLAGEPRWDVVKMFNESGIPTARGNQNWRAASVYYLLRRWRNAALVEYEGEPVGEAKWQPIISRDDLEAVRAILATPVRESSGKPPATLLSGIAHCHCGEVLHAHGMSWARVYRCASMDTKWDRNDFEGKQVAIKIEKLDARVRDAVVESYFDAPSGGRVVDQETAACPQSTRN